VLAVPLPLRRVTVRFAVGAGPPAGQVLVEIAAAGVRSCSPCGALRVSKSGVQTIAWGRRARTACCCAPATWPRRHPSRRDGPRTPCRSGRRRTLTRSHHTRANLPAATARAAGTGHHRPSSTPELVPPNRLCRIRSVSLIPLNGFAGRSPCSHPQPVVLAPNSKRNGAPSTSRTMTPASGVHWSEIMK